ncbi:MAG: acyltransferase [Desulfamplus sp.]|nr:acyltransferase [Desulfamplus sp.]
MASKNSDTVYTIQAFRGVAAILVVLFHATQLIETYFKISPLGGLFMFGFSGVHLFFVLSGFIIFMVHFKDIDKPRRYFRYLKKRFIRIYPIYWITLAMISSWLLVNHLITIENVYQNIALLMPPPSFINPVCWTLSFEVFFYIIFSFLILNRILGTIILLCWMVGVILTNFFGVEIYFIIHYAFHKYTVLFMIGGAVSYIAMYLKKLAPYMRNKLGYSSFICGIIIFSLTAFYCSLYKIINWDLWIITLGFGLAGGMLMLSSLSDNIERFFGSQKSLAYFGNASYSIYLLHYPFLTVVIPFLKIYFPINGQISITIFFLSASVLTVLAGWLLYWNVERPVLKLMRNHILAKRI